MAGGYQTRRDLGVFAQGRPMIKRYRGANATVLRLLEDTRAPAVQSAASEEAAAFG